ncbi:hypothetical protein [Stieleria varia]|uniref:Tetratricopeptide repeat protein n=1 Tax=Stieleria varia TaxID=2528005 RepID=A0A5C6B743_9BACT|nr:hypothetical protein [Stieleria varia]TWU07853.1 hypothetical protein Pla52n_04290 [Stieleria varia]
MLQSRQKLTVAAIVVAILLTAMARPAVADGEPAADFVKQLRAAGYFDTAIAYLERLDKYPGVDPDFKAATELEKAQTYIDAAVSSRRAADRDTFFLDAEKSLSKFISGPSNPRQSEARLMLGKLQMIRAAQLLSGDADNAKRDEARNSYTAASKTFNEIIDDLKTKIEDMRKEAIDARKEPKKAKLREQYQADYLQAKLNAAESLMLAAKTYDKPGTDAKAILEDALERFAELNKKYSRYPIGVIALASMGQINEMLGKTKEATDNFLDMLDQPEADPLRDAKFLAAAGYIRLQLAEQPPKFDEAIAKTKDIGRQIRPDERTSQAVQEYRVDLAKAYLAKAADKEQKPTDSKRAESDGRQLLLAASKIPGPHNEESKELLAKLGIEEGAAEGPSAEPPKSFDDGLEVTIELLSATENLSESIKLLSEQPETPELKAEIEQITKQLADTRSIAVQTIRAGLGMATSETDTQQLNQARQILAYLLYQQERHRDAAVVGSFLARTARGTPVGLDGGLVALTSLQMLLQEIPDDESDGVITQLDSLGKFLTENWPDDPKANAAQGLRIRLMLKKDDYAGAEALIDAMGEGTERAYFKRLLGQLLWNAAIQSRIDGDDAKAETLTAKADTILAAGLNEIEGNLVDAEAMQAALVLAKILDRQDKSQQALKVLDDEKYGPLKLVDTLGAPNENFSGDLYSTELKVLVKEMLRGDDPAAFLDRMSATMDNLRKSFNGPNAQQELTQTYIRLARDVSEQLEKAAPAKREKLIEVFKVFLNRIAANTQDEPTLRWVAQTLMSMGETSMQPTDVKATGSAAELMNDSIAVLKKLVDNNGDLTTKFLYARALRLVGSYKDSLDVLEGILKDKPTMLDAQIEAAQAYESWAAELGNPNFAYKAYESALVGGRPGPDNKNVIWGWAIISTQAKRNPAFRDKFFESRYHVALCLYLMGKVKKNDATMKKAIKDINQMNTLYPDMGGAQQRDKYDRLLKQIQRDVGEKPVGLPPA